MTEVVTSPAAEPSEPSEPSPAPAPSEPSDLDKIKAAQAARRTRRSRDNIAASAAPPPSPSPATGPSDAAHDEALRAEMATLRLEMSSLRRNHLHNLKKVSAERDMFAAQLAREQGSAASGPAATAAADRRLADAEVQLRAARTRNNDLEQENAVLRDDVKQLSFRVQASKTIDAATNGYERIVDDLVAVKLKCAQLQEEKEDLLRINKDLTHTSAVLTDANGELEKSRSEWVLKCADVTRQKAELDDRIKDLHAGRGKAEEHRKSQVKQDTSYDASDLHDIKLN